MPGQQPVACRANYNTACQRPASGLSYTRTVSMLKIISANLNGIRSATTKGFLDWLPAQDADFVCMQELKAQAPDMTAAS